MPAAIALRSFDPSRTSANRSKSTIMCALDSDPPCAKREHHTGSSVTSRDAKSTRDTFFFPANATVPPPFAIPIACRHALPLDWPEVESKSVDRACRTGVNDFGPATRTVVLIDHLGPIWLAVRLNEHDRRGPIRNRLRCGTTPGLLHLVHDLGKPASGCGASHKPIRDHGGYPAFVHSMSGAAKIKHHPSFSRNAGTTSSHSVRTRRISYILAGLTRMASDRFTPS